MSDPDLFGTPAPPEHLCHWPGCSAPTPPRFWGCRSHWYLLPLRIRRAIWLHYRPGQEQDKRPSVDYVEAAREAERWAIGFIRSMSSTKSKSDPALFEILHGTDPTTPKDIAR